ncbi:MAG: type 4a pilus biogenesis protein PilN [Gammaproteobacteria bacterium]
MARINLLPWREELRKARQKQFAFVAVGTVVFAALVAVYVHIHIAGLIEDQNRRNNYLKEQIRIVDSQIREIQELEKTKANLLARMNVIQELQRSRPQIVRLFDELVTTLPDGVYLTKIEQKGNSLTLDGIAQSNARVSAYMRNVDASEWLESPRLEIIEASKEEERRNAKFKLHFKQADVGEEQTEEAK